MTLPANIRVNLTSPFPSLVRGSGPVTLGKQNGIWTAGLSTNGLGIQNPPPIGNFATDYFLVWDSIAKQWIQVPMASIAQPGNAANVLLYGADNTGVNDSAAAINAALANSSTIYFPPGTYKVNSAISYTVTAGKSVMILGAGSSNTYINWPNLTNGFSISLSSINASFHIRDVTLTTSQGAGATAISVTGLNASNGDPPFSDIQNVIIRGDDLNPGGSPGTHYWASGIALTSISNIYIQNVNIYGKFAGAGVGLTWSNGTSFGTVLNVVSCSFYYLGAGVQLGNYWQGATFINCNFVAPTGSAAGLQQLASASGVLSGLWIMGCNFNTLGNQIDLNTAVGALFITANIITSSQNGSVGANLGASYQVTVTGNTFNCSGSPTSIFSLVTNGSTGTCVGNTFNNSADGVVLQSSSTLWTVALNNYNGITNTKISNSGTNNSIGTQSAGNMAGVVP